MPWMKGEGQEHGRGQEGEGDERHDEHHLLAGVPRVQCEYLILCRVCEAVDQETRVRLTLHILT